MRCATLGSRKRANSGLPISMPTCSRWSIEANFLRDCLHDGCDLPALLGYDAHGISPRPGITLVALTYLFGVYAIVDGVAAIWAAFNLPGEVGPRWWLGLSGL